MKEWITGSLFLAGVLAVLYVYGLPLAGSLWREARRRVWRRREVRRLSRVFAVPPALLK